MLKYARDTVGLYLLPQTARFYVHDRTENGGIWGDEYQSTPVNYGGAYARLIGDGVPCRLDPTPVYRSEDIFGQEQTLTMYTLNVPYDFNLEPDMKIIIDGGRFEIKRLVEYQAWAIVRQALVARLEPDA